MNYSLMYITMVVLDNFLMFDYKKLEGTVS
jgi:hypothetical protein